MRSTCLQELFSAKRSPNLLSSPPGLGCGLRIVDPGSVVLDNGVASPGRVTGPGRVAGPSRIAGPGRVILDDVRGGSGRLPEEDRAGLLLSATLQPLVESI